MKKFYDSLKEQTLKIIYLKKKRIKEQKEASKKAKFCYICKNNSNMNKLIIKIIVKDHCHYTGKHRGAGNIICNLKYSIPKEIEVFFENGTNYEIILSLKY